MYNTAKTSFRAPSDYFRDDPLDDWTAYQLDRAVTFFGNFVEGALMEMVTMGAERVRRYTIKQILDPAFFFPRDGEAELLSTPLLMTEGVMYDEVK